MKIVFFTGAGVSRESGLPTFRGEGGIWNSINPDEVASISAWQCGRRADCAERRQKALDFFNPLRRALLEHEPNQAHRLIAALERDFEVTVITQNGDDYHTRAGSTNVIYLHGEAMKNCSMKKPTIGWDIDRSNPDIHLGDKAPDGSQVRPFIIYFGECISKTLWEKAVHAVKEADIFVVVGSTMLVHPACDLTAKLPPACQVYVIDPQPVTLPADCRARLTRHFATGATEGMRLLTDLLHSSTPQ